MLRKTNATQPTEILDPIAAYDRIAGDFSRIAQERFRYLRAIEKLIAERIPPGSVSLLDVGAGNGSRSARIADEAGLSDIVLLEPSKEMVKGAGNFAGIWPLRAEDLNSQNSDVVSLTKHRRFDVIVCLWNVLGHIESPNRTRVVTQLGKMLSPHGRIFLDINHRYNVRSYGLWKTAARFLRDRFLPRATNGDVVVTWRVGNEECRTHGHVFTHGEIRKLAFDAQLLIEERPVVDYDTGELRRFGHQGNLLYVLRRRIGMTA